MAVQPLPGCVAPRSDHGKYERRTSLIVMASVRPESPVNSIARHPMLLLALARALAVLALLLHGAAAAETARLSTATPPAMTALVGDVLATALSREGGRPGTVPGR